ncbi:MAG TPA: hypothetical protein VGN27_14110 [Gaiellaceae bacterium]|jgi:hypothetical protein|nr:hypothetical protein [Gaiellaceae bacterium]
MGAAKTETPWGRAELVEELVVRQQAGERRFASVVQLLETERGERLVRFAYSTGGAARRGPVTLRERDLARLHAGLERRPELSDALRLRPG